MLVMNVQLVVHTIGSVITLKIFGRRKQKEGILKVEYELIFRPMYDMWEIRNSLYARKEAEAWIDKARLTEIKSA